ncbi:MAG TPA: RDD family protein [Terriglobales bacterium]|nr:RDD family protein [Terriglobales bacterium]
MDCPAGGDAAVQSPIPRIADGAGEAAREAPGVPDLQLDGECWRREIAARLQRYRTRRKPRPPRYPSLRLPFEAGESRPVARTSPQAHPAGAATAAAFSLEADFAVQEQEEEPAITVDPGLDRVEEPQPLNNLIEFPRLSAVPGYRGDELAEPVLDRPRILEAPEVLPPPPALGGLLIEPVVKTEDRTSAVDMPLLVAPPARRLLAGLIDGLVLAAAMAVFGAIFLWVNVQRPPLSLVVAAGMGIWAVLWASYKFLFVVYTGSTPGLRLLRLRLTRFDGSSPSRSMRRWRVLASYLSALSLGLGYLWCVLDEDGLSWHDRMTKTLLS